MNEMPHHPDQEAGKEATQRPPEIPVDQIEALKEQVNQLTIAEENIPEQPPALPIEKIEALKTRFRIADGVIIELASQDQLGTNQGD